MHARKETRARGYAVAMREPTKQELSAVAAAIKKITNEDLLSHVWSAADGDQDVAQAAAWQLVRTKKLLVGKHWLAIAPLAHGLAPVAWADLKALLDPLPPTLVEPGGAKHGWGFMLMIDPDAPGDPGISHMLVRLAIRCAVSDRDAFAAVDTASYSLKIALALDYGRAVAGLPVTDATRARLFEALTRAVVSREIAATVPARGANGALIDVVLWSGEEEWRPQDMSALGAPLGDTATWNRALKDAMLAELAFLDENRSQAKGIAFLDRCRPALALLEPAALVAVLAKGKPGGMGADEWRTVAAPAISALDANARALALAATADDANDGYYLSDVKNLLEA